MRKNPLPSGYLQPPPQPPPPAGTYNLIDEPWIPVRNRSGQRLWVSPPQICDPDLVAVDHPRHCFSGAIYQMLIGLLQTACPPRHGEWRAARKTAVTPADLRERLEPLRPAMYLDGDGPRFMQDLTLRPAGAEDDLPIRELLLDEKDGNGLFCSGPLHAMDYPTVAAALYMLQCGAPQGGTGYCVSLRGGGPLTTIVLRDTLWETLWMNVVERDSLHRGCSDPDPCRLEDLFPWMSPTPQKKAPIVPDGSHAATVYWAMPWRIRLRAEGEAGRCSVTGRSGTVVRFHCKRNQGNKYQLWTHPLTPYWSDPENGPSAASVQREPLTYVDWVGWVGGIQSSAPGKGKAPKTLSEALVVHRAQERLDAMGVDPSMVRVWAFGHAMDKGKWKALCYQDRKGPMLFLGDPEERKVLVRDLGAAVQVSLQLNNILQEALALSQYRKEDSRRSAAGGSDVFLVRRQLLHSTEADFYDLARRLADNRAPEAADKRRDLLERWLEHLCRKALQIFDARFDPAGLVPSRAKLIALARRRLGSLASPLNSSLRQAAGLAAP